MSSTVHIDNKIKNILILGKDPTQGLDDTMLTAEAQCSINFTRPNIKFCLLQNSVSYLLMLQKINQFEPRESETKKISLVLRKYFRRFFS